MIKIDRIIRTRRKTISLIIRQDGSLEVRAPLRAPEQIIREFVEQKQVWIISKQKLVLENKKQVLPKQFVQGEEFLFLGKKYRLIISTNARSGLSFNDQSFILSPNALSRALPLFEKWYKTRALEIFSERTAFFAHQGGFKYQRIRITSARTRWGSCSTRGTISFTWRLIMAPPEIIDYVIIHELVHTLEPNHAKAFWEKVAKIMPDFKNRIKWLKINGHLLKISV
ncbi:MAG: M48 family metallopeptidase [Anaerolineae bacterium]|nr:M48 family metallopeptidase [Anaerolineae bacterium]